MYPLILLVVLISFLIWLPYVCANFLRQQKSNLQTKIIKNITKDAEEVGVGITQTTNILIFIRSVFTMLRPLPHKEF